MFTILYFRKFWAWVTIGSRKSFLHYGYSCSRAMKNAVGVLSLLILSGFAGAQTPAPAANRTTGTVTSIDTAGKLIKIKTDTGEEVAVTLQDRTNYLKADADLKNTAKIALSDIAVGDRMMARGAQSEDKKAITASLVVVVTKADVAK